MTRRTERSWALVSATGVVAFTTLTVYAAHIYPGGTQFDPGTRGFSWGANYFCDLFRARGVNGAPYDGAPFAQVGALAITVAVLAGFATATYRMSRHKGTARSLAVAGFFAMVAVVMSPADRFPLAHLISIAAAGALNLITWVLILSFFPGGRPRRLGALGLVLSTLHFFQFVGVHTFEFGREAWIPPAQKAVALVDLTWLVVLAAGAWTFEGERDRHR